MAEAGFSEVKAWIEKPSRDQVGTTTARINCGCSFKFTLPENETDSGTTYINNQPYHYSYRTIYSLKETTFEWKRNGAIIGTSQSGNFRIENLTKGTGNDVSGLTVTITCIVNQVDISHVPKEKDGTVVYEDHDNSAHPREITYDTNADAKFEDENQKIWTKPGEYFFEAFPRYEINQGDYIHEKLTTSVMGAWDTLLNITGHWFNQNEQNATDDPTYTENCIISPGDVITADWFNACITLLTRYEGFDPLGRAEATATAGGPGVYEETSYITAARINLMLGVNGAKGEVE